MNMVAITTACILLSLSNIAVTHGFGRIPPKSLSRGRTYHPWHLSHDIREFIETDENHENVHIEKRSSPLFEENAKEFERRIVWFLKTMRIFVSNTSFDYLGFESQIEEYRNDLADIEFTVENSPQFENRIGAQLEFAKHLFWVLVATTEKMKRHEQSRLPGHSLVFEMMHINVCAMLLLNAHAELDISIDGYFKKLRLLHEAYTLLMEKYDLMGSKQAHMRIFEIQALQTKHNLETLSSSLEVSQYFVKAKAEP